jgi:uncharacterized membrane protein YsdA (DUF1294 family)
MPEALEGIFSISLTFAKLMIYALLLINLFTLVLFGLDKKRAIKHQRRISENMLLISAFLGGTGGAILGIFIFRHKISKISFLLKLGLVFLVQIVLIYFFKKYA